MTDIELGWTAGIIDGEGCIRMQKNYGLSLTVGNTNLDMLLKLRDLWGGRIYISRHSYRNARPFHQWQLAGRAAIAVIHAVRPHLIVKVRQADLALQLEPLIGKKNNYELGFNDALRVQRAAIYTELRQANQRGIQ